MCYRNILLLSLIVIGNLNGVRTKSGCETNEINKNMCNIMNTAESPCKVFNNFVCGGFVDATKYTSMYFDTFLKRAERENKEKLVARLVLKTSKMSATSIEEDPVASLYISCMNREKQGIQPMLQLINKYGGWPVLSEYDPNAVFDRLNLTKELLKLDFNIAPILKIKYMNSSSSTEPRYLLERPTFAMNPDLLIINKIKYLQLMTTVAIEFGANEMFSVYDMFEVLQFEIRLIEIGYQNRIFAVKPWEKRHEYPSLMKYIQNWIDPKYKNELFEFLMIDPDYFEMLEDLLKSTKEHIIANYLIWRVVVAASEYLTPKLNRHIKVSIEAMGSTSKFEPGYYPLAYVDIEDCFNYVNEFLPMGLDNMYISDKKTSISNTRSAVRTIASQVRRKINVMIQLMKWMNDELFMKIMTKFNDIQFIVANPEEYSDYKENLDKLLSLRLDTNNFLGNILAIRNYQKRFPVKTFRSSAWAVEAEYLPYSNDIYIPAGLLQPPLFYPDAPSYFTYGSFGFLIGRTIAKAFNETNRKLTTQAYYVNWPQDFESNYTAIYDCFKTQYASMQNETGIKPNIHRTIHEDILDYIAGKAAYAMYLEENAAKKPDLLFDYTDSQLFWISMLQTLCGFTDPSIYEEHIDNDLQSLSLLRVLYMTINFPEIRKEFKCPVSEKELCKFL